MESERLVVRRFKALPTEYPRTLDVDLSLGRDQKRADWVSEPNEVQVQAEIFPNVNDAGKCGFSRSHGLGMSTRITMIHPGYTVQHCPAPTRQSSSGRIGAALSSDIVLSKGSYCLFILSEIIGLYELLGLLIIHCPSSSRDITSTGLRLRRRRRV